MLTVAAPTGQGALRADLKTATRPRTSHYGAAYYGTLPPTGYDAPTGAWVNAVSPGTT